MTAGRVQLFATCLGDLLFPEDAGETHTFRIVEPQTAAARTITLQSANVTSTPVQNVKTIATLSGPVGYMLFNDHLATSEGQLVTAIATLSSASIVDLVIDVRYNGGGYLDIASELAYMIAGTVPTAGQTFERLQFNDKHTAINPVTGEALTPVPFHTTTQGFSTTPDQPLPTLNLTRVYLLTGLSPEASLVRQLPPDTVHLIQQGGGRWLYSNRP